MKKKNKKRGGRRNRNIFCIMYKNDLWLKIIKLLILKNKNTCKSVKQKKETNNNLYALML